MLSLIRKYRGALEAAHVRAETENVRNPGSLGLPKNITNCESSQDGKQHQSQHGQGLAWIVSATRNCKCWKTHYSKVPIVSGHWRPWPLSRSEESNPDCCLKNLTAHDMFGIWNARFRNDSKQYQYWQKMNRTPRDHEMCSVRWRFSACWPWLLHMALWNFPFNSTLITSGHRDMRIWSYAGIGSIMYIELNLKF